MPILEHQVRRNRQRGYSLVMVIFLVATIIILTAVASPSILTQGRREREAETVWRGEQYERAIGMYYKKFGRYPTKVEDLTRQTNGVRFLRKAYTDPMNKDDGSWRFIYVGPNGQLIGSLRSTSLMQSVMNTATLPGGGFAGAASGLGAVLSGALSPGGATNPGAGSGAAGQTGSQTSQQPGQQTTSSSTPGNPSTPGFSTSSLADAQPQPLGSDMIGGNIIGVGSKIKQPSFRVYLGGDTYQKWEFIWNPVQQVAIPGQPAAPVAPPGVAAPNGAPVAPGTPGGPPLPTNGAPTVPGQPGSMPTPLVPSQ
ncbi:MAG: type II secretion system protein [Candidatus Acidiferrales bacterium]